MQCLDGHISTYLNKDTRDLFMLCIVLMWKLCCVLLFFFVACLLCCCPTFVPLLFNFCFHSILLFIVHCSWEKIFNSDPGLYSRYFDSVVCEVPVPLQHHHLCKSNEHHMYIRLHRLCLNRSESITDVPTFKFCFFYRRLPAANSQWQQLGRSVCGWV